MYNPLFVHSRLYETPDKTIQELRDKVKRLEQEIKKLKEEKQRNVVYSR